MQHNHIFRSFRFLLYVPFVIAALLFTGCDRVTTPTPAVTAPTPTTEGTIGADTPVLQSQPTETPVPPTLTPTLVPTPLPTSTLTSVPWISINTAVNLAYYPNGDPMVAEP